jgi:arylsulfatase
MTNFHNNAKCSETRASIMTGLWHQQSRNLRKPGHVTMAEVLRDAGYTTLMSGKWHLHATPRERGFDRYFGFLSGAINFFTGLDWGSGKNLMRLDDDEFVAGTDFYSTDAFTDYAIEFLDEARQKDRPYFLYLAHNAPHFPLHAPAEDIAKYRGRYDVGWDQIRKARYEKMTRLGIINETWPLSGRDPKVEPWNKLTQRQADFLIPMMEVYAAMVDRLDQNVGRLLEDLRSHDELDNTLIVFFSDNGACPYQRLRSPGVPPGGPDSDYAYDARWANMCNTPLRLYKQYAHQGGTLTPMIVHLPQIIRQPGAICRYTSQIVDLMPTIVEITEAEYPKERDGTAVLPMEGVSLLSAWTGNSVRRERPIFWEFKGNHAVRDGNWKLVAERGKTWELYDLSKDRTETVDLADSDPARVASMARTYDAWASRVGATPHAEGSKLKPSNQSQLFDLP